MNIYLVGYRGTGKTSVAPALAKRLGGDWRAVDMDPILESEAEMSIAEIFAREGEVGFRAREEELLSRLARAEHLVVATGGGVIERPANRALLKGQLVCWLEASVETLAQRLDLDATTRSRRPSLTGKSGIDEIREVLTRRNPLYDEVARWRLDTESHSPAEIADQLEELFRARSG